MKKHLFLAELRMVRWIASLEIAICYNNLAFMVVAIVSNNLLTKYGVLTEFGSDILITTFGLCMKNSLDEEWEVMRMI